VAWRVPIDEDVKSAAGLAVTGASITVRAHGGAQVNVYSAENGGSALLQPLTSVNGKIVEAGSQAQPYVPEGDYDFDVTFGGDTLTQFVPVRRGHQFVITLPAGAGTAAPEDGEEAVELYDAANGGAWLRRYRAASVAADKWDMVGGPPPASNALPASPRVRQEVYLTGSNPPIQHMRFNGTAWEYVGTPPTVPTPGVPLSILDVGLANQHRAGRNLTSADFTTLLKLPSTPIGVFPLDSLTNLGSGGALTNKGAVAFTTGIMGTTHAAQFTGSTGQALYIADTGVSDPFRIKTGSWGAWMRTAKRGVTQYILTKSAAASPALGWFMQIAASNAPGISVSVDGITAGGIAGISDVADDRWHHMVGTFDGTRMRLYVDGVLEASAVLAGVIFSTSGPLNIGGWAADATTATTSPFFGRIDEAFVTSDVLSDDQVRLLYAGAIPHGYVTIPSRVVGSVRRRQRGGALAITDFPTQPTRLHNFVAGVLSDDGSGATALTSNPGTGAIVAVAAPDGTKDGAYSFSGAHTGLSATDAGLPSGLSARSYGIWFKSTAVVNQTIIGWGTAGTADARLAMNPAIYAASGTDAPSGPNVNDGLWHHAVVVEDNAAVDGVKRKVYLDGRLVVTSTVLTSLTLAGASRFRIGAAPDGTVPFGGQASRAFVYAGALTSEQVRSLYNLGARALGPSPYNIAEMVEGMDATNLYVIADRLDGQNQLDLAVAA
jgi:hypothetical protein